MDVIVVKLLSEQFGAAKLDHASARSTGGCVSLNIPRHLLAWLVRSETVCSEVVLKT